MRRWIVALAGPVIGVILVVLGLGGLDWFLRARLRNHPRFTASIFDIDCPTPASMARDQFLSEVADFGRLSNPLQILDDNLKARLEEAFAKHPWVAKVDRVEIADNQVIRIHLTFRQPVLAIPQPGRILAVDRQGVLLPGDAPVVGLVVWRGPLTSPLAKPGFLWGDKDIESTADILGVLASRSEYLSIKSAASRLGEVTFTTQNGSRILWGHFRNREAKEEADFQTKTNRIEEFCREREGQNSFAAPFELDLRPRDKKILRRLKGGIE